MVVHDFYVVNVSLLPNEADAPLIVDADAVLANSIAFESFQSVARGHSQIHEALSVVQHPQFPTGYPLHLAWQLPGPLPSPDLFRRTASEGSDHEVTITPDVI
jgi:hypothetical protein